MKGGMAFDERMVNRFKTCWIVAGLTFFLFLVSACSDSPAGDGAKTEPNKDSNVVKIVDESNGRERIKPTLSIQITNCA